MSTADDRDRERRLREARREGREWVDKLFEPVRRKREESQTGRRKLREAIERLEADRRKRRDADG